MGPKDDYVVSKSPVMITLDELISHLHKVFDSDHVNIECVDSLMQAYKSNLEELGKFTSFDQYRYTRNLVDAGNGKYNLILVCWGGGQKSPVHDHAESHCFMKTLSGSLSEVRYAWPDSDSSDDENQGLKEISRSKLGTGEVCYINDSLGLHSVENSSEREQALSLHLYCPPINSCNLFDHNTGHRTKCQVTFWSKYGERTTCGRESNLIQVPAESSN